MKDVRYKKVWKITERKEGQVNKKQVQEIVLSDIVVKDESTARKKEVRAQRDNEYTHEDDDGSPMKMMMNTHQRRNCSEPSDLKTPK